MAGGGHGMRVGGCARDCRHVEVVRARRTRGDELEADRSPFETFLRFRRGPGACPKLARIAGDAFVDRGSEWVLSGEPGKGENWTKRLSIEERESPQPEPSGLTKRQIVYLSLSERAKANSQ